MNKAARIAIATIVIAVVFGALGLSLDREETSVALTVTGLGLVLAWYSILDLQEQRKERFWPHTFDRLVQATFVAVTLSFAVHIAATPPATQPPPHVCPAVPPSEPAFADALRALHKDGKWNNQEIQSLANKHFAGLKTQPYRGRHSLGLQLFGEAERSITLTPGAPITAALPE